MFAVAGTGVASVATISALSKKEKKQTKSIADSEVNRLAPSLSVAKAADSDKVGGIASNGFLPSSGKVQIQVGPDNWEAVGGGDVSYQAGVANLTYPSNVSGADYVAAVTLPSLLQGRSLQIDSFELCYSVSAGATMDSVNLLRFTNTTANPNPNVNASGDIVDDTNRNDTACRTYAAGGPVTVGPNDLFSVAVRANLTAVQFITVGRLTINMTD